MISFDTIMERMKDLPTDSKARQMIWSILHAQIALSLIINTCPLEEREFWVDHVRELLLVVDYILEKEGL
jgi:hypothetical protein